MNRSYEDWTPKCIEAVILFFAHTKLSSIIFISTSSNWEKWPVEILIHHTITLNCSHSYLWPHENDLQTKLTYNYKLGFISVFLLPVVWTGPIGKSFIRIFATPDRGLVRSRLTLTGCLWSDEQEWYVQQLHNLHYRLLFSYGVFRRSILGWRLEKQLYVEQSKI